MGFQKRKSTRILEQAEVRAASMAAINPNLDLGDNRSLEEFNGQIEKLQAQINAYNTAVTALETIRSDIKEREKTLREFSAQMLLGVAFKYGRDSLEYQLAGGVRQSERSRRSNATRTKEEEAPEAAPEAAPETSA